MSTELENPGATLATELRTLLLVAVKLGELVARRVEMRQRHARSQAVQVQRDVERRIRAELGVAENQLKAVRGTMRTLAGVDPAQIAASYQTAVAWRERSAVAQEVATSIETYARNLGIDPEQLRRAGTTFARTTEPTSRAGLDFDLTDTDRQRAASTDERWRATLDAELRQLGPTAVFSAVAVDPARREQIRAELDRVDAAAAREDYARTQGLTSDDELTPDMLGRWREQQAIRWGTDNQVADLALFTALLNAEDDDEAQGFRTGMVGLWMAWRARESEGLPHPDLAELSVAAFGAQLDRAHAYFADTDPDFYDNWTRMRATDPTRADRNLVQRYEIEQAQQWAAEIGDDLWKHGFARAAAQNPDADLEEIARRIWVGAGKPEPAFDPDVAVVPLAQRWAGQIEAASKIREQIEAAPEGQHQDWRDWVAWRADPDLPPGQRVRQDAELVADYHLMQAEQWEAAAVEEGTLDPGVATRETEQLMAAWRRHTGGQDLPVGGADAEVFARAQRWLLARDPLAYLGVHAQMDAATPDRRDQIREELVRDYETFEARRWAEAAEITGIVEEGTAALDPEELIKQWRAFTADQQQRAAGSRRGTTNAQQPPHATEAEAGQAQQWFLNNDLPSLQRWEREVDNATTAEQEQTISDKWVAQWRRDSTAARRAPGPNLADLVRRDGQVPDWVIGQTGWQYAERAFRGLVAAGADPRALADSLGDLRYDEAAKPIGLTIWKMQETAGPQVTEAFKQSGGAGQAPHGGRRRPGRGAPGGRSANMGPAAARSRRVADRAFGSWPREAVDDGTGTETPRTRRPSDRTQQRTQGRGL